jgi:pyruvate/2-oxoglutarate/acetoin dehydrogenase E1 component
MKHVAHGVSMTGWMMTFESEEVEPSVLWNEAVSKLDTDTQSRIVEQTNRMISVHPEAQRCGMCPIPPEVKPAEVAVATGQDTPEPDGPDPVSQ